MYNPKMITVMTIDLSLLEHQVEDTLEWTIMRQETCLLKAKQWSFNAMALIQGNILFLLVSKLLKDGQQVSNILLQ